jgi:Protein NO VEIN, C-terminal
LADQDKIGTPWSGDELDAIIADYFAMLSAELSGQSYVKSHHSAALMLQIGRTHRSVEFKHQNISAVLDELGLPWIPGYKPKRNYQAAIFGAIDRYLSANVDITYQQPPPVVLHAAEDAGLFVDPPPLQPAINRPPQLMHLLRKFDPVERDFRNRALGKAGEEFVLKLERKKLVRLERSDLARKVRWVAMEDGDGAGYDVLSFEPNGRERLIEVKTTNGAARTPFFLTRNEREVATARAESWQLYRVHLFAQRPRIFTIRPPLEATLHLRAEAWRASFTQEMTGLIEAEA